MATLKRCAWRAKHKEVPVNQHIDQTEKTRVLVDEVTEKDSELASALNRLSHISRAITAYVEDAQRNLLVAARNPQGVTVSFERWGRGGTPRRPRR